MITSSYNLTATERVLPKLALDFTTANLDSRVTLSRALNTATVTNSTGSIEVVNANLPRFDYDSTTLVCKGLLIEEARVNSIRNNTMQGVATGTPGTSPTNWVVSTTGSGITRTIVGSGTENGIEYVDIKYTGTASVLTTITINFESSTQIAALSGETWSGTCFVKLVDGSLTNFPLLLTVSERNLIGTNTGISTLSITPSNSSLISQRFSLTRTLNGATTAYVRSGIQADVQNGAAIDVTLRVGLPQLEKGAFATSVIKTTNAAVTRNADVATMTGTNFSDWYNASEGTFFVSGSSFATDATRRIFSVNDTTTQNLIDVNRVASSSQVRATVTTLNVSQFNSLNNSWPVNTTANVVIAYKQNDFAAALSGDTPKTDTSGTIPTVTQIVIGNLTNHYWCGYIRKLNYWPQRLTTNEVQAFSK